MPGISTSAHPIWGPKLVGGTTTVPATKSWHRSEARETSAGTVASGVDAAIALGALGVALVLARGVPITDLGELLRVQVSVRSLVLVGVLVTAWTVAMRLWGQYGRGLTSWRRLLGGTSSAGLLVLALSIPFGALSAGTAVVFWCLATAATLGLRGAERVLAPWPSSSCRRVLIVGSGPRALRLYREICAAPAGRREFVGFVDRGNHSGDAEFGRHRVGTPADLNAILLREAVDEVVVALPMKSCYAEIQQVIETCEAAGVESTYPEDVFQCRQASRRREDGSPMRLVSLQTAREGAQYRVKRAIDVAGAAAGLLLLAPLIVLIALAIKVTSPGPVVFVQPRYGFGRRRFPMLKFRTMVADAESLQESLESRNEADGPMFKIRADPRITPLGRFLRCSSLDEIPQLVNVLRGEMSLVGPRPLPIRDVHRFGHAWQMRRFSVRPGLTCIWQVSGRCSVSFEDWMAMDLEYIDNWSLQMDVRLIALTVPAILRGTGAV